MAEIQDVINKLEEIIAKYPYGASTIPWGLIRDDLIHSSEQLKTIQGYVIFLEEQVTNEPESETVAGEVEENTEKYLKTVSRWNPQTGRQERKGNV